MRLRSSLTTPETPIGLPLEKCDRLSTGELRSDFELARSLETFIIACELKL
ncbi:MAG: hypothetical protein NT070_02690 [Cyanobacteria bacterium]|nr:hypothetical protein [Cyanobacteriota bacterium]